MQGLQSPKSGIENDTLRALQTLRNRTQVAVQWIPGHVMLSGNTEADRLAREGGQQEQTNPPISHLEVKTTIKNHFKMLWDREHPHPRNDPLLKLPRWAQTAIFRLRTGHCRLSAHMYRMGRANSPDCPCGSGNQTPEHILEECTNHKVDRKKYCPRGTPLQTKLWGMAKELLTTANFVKDSHLNV